MPYSCKLLIQELLAMNIRVETFPSKLVLASDGVGQVVFVDCIY